ncbi:MAG: hypothetical protein BEU03_01075 [Marine Group III euryarchaeote CG-Epi6]|uniref:ATP-grasp domain-containing protein n=1 Tax=Marine Group III euryarchaeote CG-Epi6 TaxID=1889000 RepID=A0A1J5SP32_9ARCH|nr:MAG: hypothetical protein BEU03_01075 [Marine Group III euryarchaeote CG-Epi6]
MNILLTSIGIRSYLVDYFKSSGKVSNVFSADNSSLAPGIYNSDKYFLVPKIDDVAYVTNILDICVNNSVSALIPLHDLDSLVLSREKLRFQDLGIKIFTPENEVVEICFDKYKCYEFLRSHNIPVPKTYIDLQKVKQDINEGLLSFPLILKSRTGSASKGLQKLENVDDLNYFWSEKDTIIQELIDGVEYGVDALQLNSKDNYKVYIKKKLWMRAGETDKAVTSKNKIVYSTICQLLEQLVILGPLDVDIVIKDNLGYIIDINPRFGGGYSLSHEVGANFPKEIIKSLLNESRLFDSNLKYDEGVIMMKHPQFTFFKGGLS